MNLASLILLSVTQLPLGRTLPDYVYPDYFGRIEGRYNTVSWQIMTDPIPEPDEEDIHLGIYYNQDYYAPTIEFWSPLYQATFNADYRMVDSIYFTVREEDTRDRTHQHHSWVSPDTIQEHLLEIADYHGSRYRPRHCRSRLMSRGSRSHNDVGFMGVVYPLHQDLIPQIDEMDYLIIQKAKETGLCRCQIHFWYSEDFHELLPNADEDHRIPWRVHYLIWHPGMQEGGESYFFDNRDPLEPQTPRRTN